MKLGSSLAPLAPMALALAFAPGCSSGQGGGDDSPTTFGGDSSPTTSDESGSAAKDMGAESTGDSSEETGTETDTDSESDTGTETENGTGDDPAKCVEDSSYLAWYVAGEEHVELVGMDLVREWRDVDQMFPISQLVATSRPTLSAGDSSTNNQPYLDFDGDDWLEGAFPDFPDEATIVVVGRTTESQVDEQAVLEFHSGAGQDNVNTGISIHWGAGGNGMAATSNVVFRTVDEDITMDPTWSGDAYGAGAGIPFSLTALTGIYRPGLSSLRYNNSVTATGSPGPLFYEVAALTVGSLDTSSYRWRGPITEILVYDRVITMDEIICVQDYLSDRYAIEF